MIIRKAQMADAPQIHEIEVASFSTPWSLGNIENDLSYLDECTLYYVLEEDGRVIGYAGAWLVADEGQITNVAVLPPFRRDGNGLVLVRKLLRELFKLGMEEIFLEVRLSNLVAIALYRKLGFSVKGLRKDYYQDPLEDAYIMSIVKEEVTW